MYYYYFLRLELSLVFGGNETHWMSAKWTLLTFSRRRSRSSAIPCYFTPPNAQTNLNLRAMRAGLMYVCICVTKIEIYWFRLIKCKKLVRQSQRRKVNNCLLKLCAHWCKAYQRFHSKSSPLLLILFHLANLWRYVIMHTNWYTTHSSSSVRSAMKTTRQGWAAHMHAHILPKIYLFEN